MRRFLLAGLSALTLAVAAPGVSSAAPHHFSGGYHGYHGYGGYPGRFHDGHGGAAFAGVAGLALGAALGLALSDTGPAYYGPPPPYYDYGYAYPPPGYYPERCYRRELVWDPYLRRNVEVEHPFPC